LRKGGARGAHNRRLLPFIYVPVVGDSDFEHAKDVDGKMAFHLLVNNAWLGGIEDEVGDILHALIPDFDG